MPNVLPSCDLPALPIAELTLPARTGTLEHRTLIFMSVEHPEFSCEGRVALPSRTSGSSLVRCISLFYGAISLLTHLAVNAIEACSTPLSLIPTARATYRLPRIS